MEGGKIKAMFLQAKHGTHRQEEFTTIAIKLFFYY